MAVTTKPDPEDHRRYIEGLFTDLDAASGGGPLTDRQVALARASAKALAAQGAEVVERLLDRLERSPNQLIEEALASIGPALLPNLLRRIEGEGGRLTGRWARLLGATRSRAALPIVLRSIADSDEGVRECAAVAMGYLRVPEAGPILVKALRDRAPGVREAAARALGQIAFAPAEKELVEVSDDADPEVRSAAVGALGQLAGRASIDHVLTALDDDDIRVRITAIEAVGENYLHAAVPRLLRRLILADPGVGTGTEIDAIFDALMTLADEASEAPLIAYLTKPHPGRSGPPRPTYAEEAVMVLEVLDSATARRAAGAWWDAHGLPN